MKCIFFGCLLILCPYQVGAQSFSISRLHPINPGTYAGDSGKYVEAQVHWFLPVAGMQDVYAEAGLGWNRSRWIARIQHYGDALFREGKLGAVWAKREGRVSLGAGLDYVERRYGQVHDRRYAQVDLGMWAGIFPGLEVGLHVSGPVSSYLHMGSRWQATSGLLLQLDGILQRGWTYRAGLLYRIRPKILVFSYVSHRSLGLGLALKSQDYGMYYGLESRPYPAYSHLVGMRYESIP